MNICWKRTKSTHPKRGISAVFSSHGKDRVPIILFGRKKLMMKPVLMPDIFLSIGAKEQAIGAQIMPNMQIHP